MRLVRLAGHVALGLGIEAFVFPHVDEKRRAQAVARWSRRLLRIANVRLSLTGEIPASPEATLIVANHVSWLDIFVINSLCPSRFVAKSEIRRWPVVGWLCAKAGTLFLHRDDRRSLRQMNETIAQVLKNGQRVAIFPEGTTTAGRTAAHFHASLLEPAILAQARVVPVAIRFPLADGSPNAAVAYVGETSFWQSVRQVLSQREIGVTLDFFPPIASGGKNRRELARIAETFIASALAHSRMPLETASDRAGEPQSASAPIRNPYPAPSDYPEAQGQGLTSGRKSLGH